MRALRKCVVPIERADIWEGGMADFWRMARRVCCTPRVTLGVVGVLWVVRTESLPFCDVRRRTESVLVPVDFGKLCCDR